MLPGQIHQLDALVPAPAPRLQILSVAFSDSGDAVYTAGIENVVNVWDLRREEVSMTLAGHGDSITGMRLSPDGTHLLTNSMDNTLRAWDMRPYAPANRCTKVFAGHVHTFEKNLLRCDWSPDGQKVRGRDGMGLRLRWVRGACMHACSATLAQCGCVWVGGHRGSAPLASLPSHSYAHRALPSPRPAQVTAGSGDRCVYIWDANTRHLMYKLPGHSGSVNECVFHPSEPIIGSASSDKTIYLGELAQ